MPSDLFDSVADNLIENALSKSSDPAVLQVRVTLSVARGGTLTVCDNGAAIANDVADELFENPVQSHTGLGIGLFQAAKQADQIGYRLSLAANEPGMVCFVLTQDSGKN